MTCMDKLRALRTLVAIADAGSLTAASRQLETSLQSVMRSLSDLEASLGTRLVNRTTRRLALTAAGRDYLDKVRRVLADLEDADGAAQSGQAIPRGSLVVTAPVLLGQMHVAGSVMRFIERHPDIAVRLECLDRVCNLVDEGIDVAVRVGDLPDSSLVAHALGQVRQVVVASPGYLQANGVPQHPGDLAQANCLRFSGPHPGPWTFRAGRRQVTVPVQGNLECNLAAPLLDACARGLGLARVQSYQAAPFIRSGRLQVVLKHFEMAPHAVSAVHASRRLQPAAVRALVAWFGKDLAPALQPADYGA
jgi:DNA-binding transcriptional LysR family regulator